MRWSGNNKDYETYFREFWTAKMGEAAFNKSLQDGVAENVGVSAPVAPVVTTASTGGVDAAKAAISGYKKGSGTEIVLYQKVGIGTGSQAGNPWLQELPDPVSRATWDNYALISMAKAKELGISLNKDYEYYPDKPVINIKLGNKELELPILVIPGMNAETIAIAVGYGRNEGMGVTAAGVGKNAYILSAFNGANVDYFAAGATVTNTGRKQKLAQTQIHNSYEDRKEVVRETTLATFKKYPNSIPAYREHLKEAFYKNANNDFRQATLYPQHEQPGPKWGMTIDMNACNGCGACVVACSAENNVPVVGKREVLRYHDMHWMRIDRYFVSDHSDPDNLKAVVFQPMLCQHCDNAPCENVCPVNATNHSAEGINQMAYNRCIGTRYCANNCPFKVRRFNWADYNGADSFKDNQDQSIVGKLDDVIFQMNDELTRMVLNPDVTVRSRGVMEKCTFCIQRTQAAKLKAKKENRMLKDGDAVTACQQACPSKAITFGNAHDQGSMVSKIRQENPQRGFYVLEQLHVLPNITYMAKIRNTEEVIEDLHAVGDKTHQENGSKPDSSGHIPARPETETH
jgi:molybdopterin-containing oxidoreductase family iron-sulfur binding subunit